MTESAGRIRRSLLACAVGTVVAFAGIGLLRLIALVTNFCYHGVISAHEGDPDHALLGAWAIAVPVVGGLAVGLLARFGSPDIRGHGIPETMQGVMVNQSRIPLRVAILKPLASAISIGTGGPFGAEGPVIATGGGIGSLFGQWIPGSTAERKILLAAGAAAGMTVAFGTPLAGLLLAIEMLLFEFRGRSFIPVALATGAAMAVRGCFGEPLPMLPLELQGSPGPLMAFASMLIGLLVGFAGVGVTAALHGLEHGFEKLPFHWMWWPSIGGLAVGVIGWVDPRTLGPGYPNLQALIDGDLALTALVTLLVFKFLSWSICLASGTSGGTVAPVMTIGGTLGAMAVLCLHRISGLEGLSVGLGALVGMCAIFAGVSRALLMSVTFGVEATHAPEAAAPLLLGCACAVIVSRLCMRETMMTEKMARKGVRVPADFEPDPLQALDVGSVMNPSPLTVPPEMTAAGLAGKIAGGEPAWDNARLFPVIGKGNVLLGIISRADVLAAVDASPDVTVTEAGVSRPVTIHADETLATAADLMIQHGIGRLPVVDRSSPPRLLGLVGRREILQARQHRMDAEKRG